MSAILVGIIIIILALAYAGSGGIFGLIALATKGLASCIEWISHKREAGDASPTTPSKGDNHP